MKSQLEEHLYNPNLFYDPKNPKLQCILQAYGTDFDPDAFLDESNLSQERGIFKGIIGLPDEIREKIKSGELADSLKQRIKKGELPDDESILSGFDIFETPFLLIIISKATEFNLQVEEAIVFLKRNLDDLMKLRTYPNVESILIQFLTEDYDPSKHKNLPERFLNLYRKIGIHGLIIG